MEIETLRRQLLQPPTQTTPLAFSAISAEGEEAQDFLQGQLTLDLRELAQGQHRLAAWCNAKGRVWALLRIFRSATGFILLVPRDQADAFLRRLRMFVLRARVTLQTLELGANGEIGSGREPGVTTELEGWRLALDHDRSLLLQPDPAAGSGGDADARFKALRLLAGEPEITAATQEKFLPQSLNLQALGGLHFNKGCYVGQEIVARVHYRGRPPQRLVTLINPEDARLDGGVLLDEVYVGGQRIVHLIEHVRGDAAN